MNLYKIARYLKCHCH